MSRQAAPRRNIYYNDVEMRCKEEAIDGGIYDFVVENAVVPEPKQVPLERQASTNKRGKACKKSRILVNQFWWLFSECCAS